MTVRAWHVVLPLTLITWVSSTWGMAVVVYLLTWWAAYVLLGGLRNGVWIGRPLRGYGEECATRLAPSVGRRFYRGSG